LLQWHPASAIPHFVRNRITGAAATAITEKEAGPREADPLQRFAAAAFGRITCILLAFAALCTGAQQGLIPFYLDHMSPNHRLAAAAVARAGTDRVTVALFTAIAGVKDIMPGFRYTSRVHGAGLRLG